MAMDPPPLPAKKRRPQPPVFNGSNGKSTEPKEVKTPDPVEADATTDPPAKRLKTEETVEKTGAPQEPPKVKEAAERPAQNGNGSHKVPPSPPAAPQESPAAQPSQAMPVPAPVPVPRKKVAAQKDSQRAAEQLPAGPVYGFGGGFKAESRGKAIALRLEPLKPGLPEYEKVLGEQKQTVSIGSNRGKVDVAVRDEAVSKKHLSLSIVGIHGDLALSVVDHSTNGSFLNGHRLPEKNKRYRIRNGDKLTLKAPDIEEDCGWKVDFGNTVAYFTRA